MSSGQEALILGVSLSVLLPPSPRTGRSGAVNALEPLCECCHISASLDLSVVIIERCNVYTEWRRSAPLIVSIVWLLIKDYCPLQQGRTGLQGTAVYGMFVYALV